ncbi:MAG: hypothetical protein GZ090_08560 [Oxalobacteraceae bacterium]|nr:hypothetical protein [Oxalobacteraceae bacterium]
MYEYGAPFSVRVMLFASVKTMLLTLLAFARTPMLRALPSDIAPFDLNVAMSAPVFASTTVKLVTACAATHIGTHSKEPKEITLHVVEMFILFLLVSGLKEKNDGMLSMHGTGAANLSERPCQEFL